MHMETSPVQPMPPRPRISALLRHFLCLGSLAFGGPVAPVGYMQRDLVERRGWSSREASRKSLALSRLAPGPLAAQLVICLGYVHSRVRGTTPVALAFVLPFFLMTVGLRWFYGRSGGLAWRCRRPSTAWGPRSSGSSP